LGLSIDWKKSWDWGKRQLIGLVLVCTYVRQNERRSIYLEIAINWRSKVTLKCSQVCTYRYMQEFFLSTQVGFIVSCFRRIFDYHLLVVGNFHQNCKYINSTEVLKTILKSIFLIDVSDYSYSFTTTIVALPFMRGCYIIV
jgi:hypothetical protein